MCTGIHPIQCIVPPHMLKAIAERGNARQQQMARETLLLSEQLRGLRNILCESPELAGPAVAAQKERVVYDAQNGTNLPGSRARGEGDPPTGDAAVDEAYDGAGLTYDLYWDVYQRNSIDGDGMRLDSTAHYGQGYDNAFWNGQQMVYGDGDEDLPAEDRLFNRFTIARDIIGHELTHGVIQCTAGLVYRDQPGALNESFADVFGALVRQRELGHAANQADWIVGVGIFTSNVNGVGIRSMKDPGTAYDDPVLGKDPQPAHMNDYQDVDYDNGGVHINSGIPNRAFYLAASEIGGNAWEKAGLIWYRTLTDSRLGSTPGFQKAADLTFQVAGEVFQAGGSEQRAVRNGWAAVGVEVGAANGNGNGDGNGDGKPGCALALASLFIPG